jgi:hypothetical protein
MAFSGDKAPEFDDYGFWYEDLSAKPSEEISENIECPPENVLGQGSKPFEVSCKPSWKKEKYCRCVRAEAEHNVFIKINLTNPQEPLEAIEKNQIFNTKKFVNAYSQMTVEADLQEQVLGLNLNPPDSKIANCTPKDFAEKVKADTETHFENQNLLLNDMLKKRNDAFVGCRVALNKLLAKAKTSQNALHDQNGKCSKLKTSIEAIEYNLKAQNGDMTDQASYGCAAAATRLTKIALKKRLEIALSYYSDKKLGHKIAETKKMLETIEINESGVCFAPGMSSSERASAFLDDFDVEYGAAGGITNRKEQCKGMADGGAKDLCLALENTNTVLADELKNDYDFDPKSECISFAEFKTFKGMPGDKLLNAFTSATRFFPSDLLITPTNGTSPLDSERLDFLRSNPLIAKLAQNDSTRKALGGMLKNLGKSLEGKNEFEKFNAYLAFMKDEKKGLKSLLMGPKAETTEMYICDQLIKNFTAIQVSNDLPQVEKTKDPNEDIFEGNIRKIKSCQVDEHNEISVTKLEETLQASPIFSLASSDAEGDKKKTQVEFEKFKGKYCEGYKEKYTGYSGTPEQRRKQFLDQSPFSGYKKSLDQNGVPATANIDWNEARKSTSEARHDTELQKWWDKNERPKLSKSPIMMKGQEDKFLEDQAKDRAKASEASVASTASREKLARSDSPKVNNTVSPVSATPATGNPTVVRSNSPSTGQQIPEYAQGVPPVDLSKSIAATNIPDMIPDYENKSLIEKEQSLKDAKDYLSEKNPELLEKFPLDDEIKSLEKKIAQSENIDKTETENNKPTLSKISSNLGDTPKESGNALGTGSQSIRAVVSKDKKGYGKENDAIVSNHEQGMKDGETNTGRSPSSLEPVIVSSNTVIDFQTGKIQPSTITEELKSMNILVTKTTDEFDKIFGDVEELKKFLGEKLQGKMIESQVIKIKDPTASPEKFLLFSVLPDSQGHLRVQSVDRLFTVQNLYNNFK